MKKFFSIMSNLQTHYHFKLDFPKVDQAPQEQSVVIFYNVENAELCDWYSLERTYFNYLECSYNTQYIYDNNNKLSIQTATKVAKRKHIIQTTGFGAYSSTWF